MCNFAQQTWFVYPFHRAEFHPLELIEHNLKSFNFKEKTKLMIMILYLRPCYACVQHNVSVYKMFETSRISVKAETSSSSTCDSELYLQTKNSSNVSWTLDFVL